MLVVVPREQRGAEQGEGNGQLRPACGCVKQRPDILTPGDGEPLYEPRHDKERDTCNDTEKDELDRLEPSSAKPRVFVQPAGNGARQAFDRREVILDA